MVLGLGAGWFLKSTLTPEPVDVDQERVGVTISPRSSVTQRDRSGSTSREASIEERVGQESSEEEVDHQKIKEQAEKWKKSLLSSDRAEVEAALHELRAAVSARKEPEAWAALIALVAVRDLNVDRSGLRDLVLAELDRGSVSRRKAAYWALYGVSNDERDIGLVYQLKNDVEMRSAIPTLLRYIDPKGLSGASGDLVAEVIGLAETEQEKQSVIKGMWGGEISSALEQGLLESSQSEDQEVRYAALYWGLSPVNPKSPEVVNRLLGYLSDTNRSTHGRAAWGLGHGVSKEDQRIVSRHVIELIALRKPGHQQRDLEGLIKNVTLEELPLIRETLRDAELSESIREKLRGFENALAPNSE